MTDGNAERKYSQDIQYENNPERLNFTPEDLLRDKQNLMEITSEIVDIFMKEFNEEREEWDIQTKIESKEDLYSKIQVIQVDIVKESYIINFILDDERWSLVKICYEGKTSYFCINPTEETEFAEMDYH